MQTAHHHVDLFRCIVKRKRSPRRRRHAETLHHGHGAMMAGPHCDTLLIQNRADVVGVNVIDHEGDHAGFFFRGADDARWLKFGERFCRIA